MAVDLCTVQHLLARRDRIPFCKRKVFLHGHTSMGLETQRSAQLAQAADTRQEVARMGRRRGYRSSCTDQVADEAVF